MLLLIDNYDSFTYNLVHYFADLGEECRVVRNDAIDVKTALSSGADGIVLSPGPCSPNEAGICCDVIKESAGKIPIFGVCLGHQAIGQVFGMKVIRAQAPVHGKTSAIYHDKGGVFKDIPNPFQATRYHSLILDPSHVSDSINVTAWTSDKIIMGISHKRYPLWGVQFHPESIASEDGHLLLRNFLTLSRLWQKNHAFG